MRILITYFLLLQSFIGLSQSSFYNEIGKNGIQYKNFKWKVIYSNNFELYFNDGSENIANIALDHIEENFSKLSSNVGHQPFKKTKIFIYNSLIDLKQSNIGINENDLFLNTNSNFNNKIQFKVAFQNNISAFKRDLNFEISKVLISDLMKGNMSFSKRFGKASFTTIPKWFSEGAARYLAYGWDIEMDNILRDYFLLTDQKKIKNINNNQSEYIGQSMWNYISIQYGKSNISNILNLSKIIRNPERAISSALGISFEDFIINWANYYSESINNRFKNLKNDSNKNLELNLKFKNIEEIKSNQSGDLIAFNSNKNNVSNLILYDTKTKKSKSLEKVKLRGNKTVFYINWIDELTVSYLKEINGKNTIVVYNTLNKRKSYKDVSKFDKINGFSYNTNKTLIAISGSIDSQKDIYLLSASSNSLKKITDDVYDDIHPHFFPNSTSIIFSSNRLSDNLDESSDPFDYEYYNLFIYNLDSTQNKLEKITNSESINIQAQPITKNKIVYLSDRKGIYNLYSHEIGRTHKQITNLNSNIENYDFNINNKILGFSYLNNGEKKVHYLDDLDIDLSSFGPQTKRVEYLQSLNNIKRANEKREEEEIRKKKDFSDTEDFRFEDDNKNNSVLNNLQRFSQNKNIKLPYDYKYSFIKNNFNTFVLVDPFEGFGTQIETDFIELFENHNLYASAFLPLSSLKSSDVFTEYSFLKYRLDFKLSFNRNIVYPEDNQNYIYHKYSMNKLSLNISYPINKFLRFEVSPFISINKFYDLDYRVLNSSPPPFTFYEKTKFSGYFVNVLYDNTNKIGMNLETGSKIKVSLGNYISKANENNNFKDFSIDFIHHQKIVNNIILSSRIFYGNSYGNNPFKYLVGGIQNSIINTKEDKGINDPLAVYNGNNNTNFLYSKYLNLRGYNLKKFDGYKALVLNTELKIPLIKTVIGKSITSKFLNNLQLIGFFDLGSSWNINSPFSSKNDVNTWYIREPGSVFQAEIENSKNPWLASYGFGIRSFIMDYFIKLDVAKPIEDYRLGQTKFHLSIGYSF